MPKQYNPRRLDLRAFAEAAGELEGEQLVGTQPRLLAETEGRGGNAALRWSAQGVLRNPQHVQPQVWLELQADTTLPLLCQRCLQPVDVELSLSQRFRFVADEATAAVEDDESEEDVLAISHEFDLMDLLADELIMAMPAAPMHASCPQPLPLPTNDDVPSPMDAAERENPFAALQALRKTEP